MKSFVKMYFKGRLKKGVVGILDAPFCPDNLVNDHACSDYP